MNTHALHQLYEQAVNMMDQILGLMNVIRKFPDSVVALQESTIGPLTDVTNEEHNAPSRLQSHKFNLKSLLENDKKRTY